MNTSTKSIKVLLADSNPAIQKSMTEYLLSQPKIECVESVCNGEEVLDKLHSFRFDILVTELAMPILDGFGVLEHINSGLLKNPPKVIVLTAMRNEEIVRKACNLGASYYMIKPTEPESVYKRMFETVEYTNFTPKKNLDERIATVFLRIGIPAHIKGYQYLRDAVKLVYNRPEIINRITKELYPSVAGNFDTSPSKVERAIRHAIEVAWTRGKIENINQIFGFNIYGRNDKPTNGEFIALVADRLIVEGESSTGS